MSSFDLGTIQKSFNPVFSDYQCKHLDRILLDSTNEIKLTLPKNPHIGCEIFFYDSCNMIKDGKINISADGQKVEGSLVNSRVILKTGDFINSAIYSGDPYGWIFTSGISVLIALAKIDDAISQDVEILPLHSGCALKTKDELLYFGMYGFSGPFNFVDKMENLTYVREDVAFTDFPRRLVYVKLCNGQDSFISTKANSAGNDFMMSYWDGNHTIVKYSGNDPSITTTYPLCSSSYDTIFTLPQRKLKHSLYGTNSEKRGFFIYNDDIVYSFGDYNLSSNNEIATIQSPTLYSPGFSKLYASSSGYALGLTSDGKVYSFGKFNTDSNDNVTKRTPELLKTGVSKIVCDKAYDSFLLLSDLGEIYACGYNTLATNSFSKFGRPGYELRLLKNDKKYVDIEMSAMSAFAREDRDDDSYSWWCWGLNNIEQLSSMTYVPASVSSIELINPSKVKYTLIKKIYPTAMDSWFTYTKTGADTDPNIYEYGNAVIGETQYLPQDACIGHNQAFHTYPDHTQIFGWYTNSDNYIVCGLNENGYITKYIVANNIQATNNIQQAYNLSSNKFISIKQKDMGILIGNDINNHLYKWNYDKFSDALLLDTNVDQVYNYGYYSKNNKIYYVTDSTCQEQTISLPSIKQFCSDIFLDSTGDVWSFDTTSNQIINPIKVLSNKSIKKIVSNKNSKYCLTSDGQVYCWGKNDYGQLGINTNVETPSPTLMSVPTVCEYKKGNDGKDTTEPHTSQSIVDIAVTTNMVYLLAQRRICGTGYQYDKSLMRLIMACGDNSYHTFGLNADTGQELTASYYTVPTPCKKTFYHPYNISLMDVEYTSWTHPNDLIVSDNNMVTNMTNTYFSYPLYIALK